MGTLEVLKGMPGFLLPGASGSPWGIFHEMTTPGLTWTFFLAGLGQFSLAVGHPTPVSQTYSHVQIIIFFHTVDTPPPWRVWKFPNAFTHKTLRSVNRCLIFETSFVPPCCLFTLYLNVAVLWSLSPLGGCHKIFLGECMWCRWISEESTGDLDFSFKVNLLHLNFIDLQFL